MFTPPPSPSPPETALKDNSESLQNVDCPATVIPCKKKRTGRYFRLVTILLPLFAIFCTTYFLHGRRTGHRPATGWMTVQDAVFPLGHHQYQMHRRHPSPQTLPGSPTAPSSTSTASKSSTSGSQIPVSDQLVPTVPNSPPVLPTPFPQAIDSGIVQNFSSSTCASFFANMTSAAPFRTCRPFSLLLGSSGAFIDAQTNLTLLNSIIWGTCNTPTTYAQCKSNMAWFAGSLQTNCAEELEDKNLLVRNTLIGLQAFEILHTAGCLSDPNLHTYCYLTAALSPNPFDLFVYSLPLGIRIPNSSTTSCSVCSKSILTVYADALRSGASGTRTLKTTFYEGLAKCQAGCGTDFSLVGAGLNPEANDARKVGYMHIRSALLWLGVWVLVFWFL